MTEAGVSAGRPERSPDSRPAPQSPPAAPGRRWAGPLLAALLAVSLGLRLVAGTAVLDNSYHFDERFSFRNVSALLVTGSGRPANAYYPGLSYLPQAAVLAASQALHRLTGIEALAVFDPAAADGYSRTAYFLVRLLAALFGTGSVWLTFLVGRRLFDERAGLLASLLLAAVPAHVSHSALFKPDILVVLLVLVAFRWSLDAVLDTPRLGRFLLAGAGVGLAVAAKYTGVGAALPLAAGVAVAGRHRPRLWLWLAAAAAASVVAFILLNPHLGVILDYLPRIWGIYESKGEAAGGSRWAMLGAEAAFLVRHHGLPVVLFAAAGLAGLAARAVRPGTERSRRLEAVMLLAFPAGYSLLYAASTTLFKGQNYLPVTPFTALAAAWAMVDLWDRLTARLPLLRTRTAALLVWTAAAAAVLAVPVREVYAGAVPTTFQRVEERLRAEEPLHLRQAYYERRRTPLRPAAGLHRLLTLPVESLARVAPADLDRSDFEVFYADRLEGPGAAFYWRRLGAAAGGAGRIEPRFLAARGAPLVVLSHPWNLQGEPIPLALGAVRGPNRFRAEAPALAPGEVVSFSFWMPLERGVPRPAWVRLDGRRLPLYETGIVKARIHLLTPRLELPREAGELRIDFEERLRLRWTPDVSLCRWRPR